INACVREGDVNTARKLFDDDPHSRNIVSWNSLMNGYVKRNEISKAQKLFDEMPLRDVVSWNTMLSGFRDIRSPDKSHRCFLTMMRYGPTPDELTFSILIGTFLSSQHKILIPQLHAIVIRLGISLNIYLGSALMRAYVALGHSESYIRVFDEIPVKDVAPYNVLILGHIEFGSISQAKKVFDEMPVRNPHSWSTIINGYMKNGMIKEAVEEFDRIEVRDVVSTTAMIRGFADVRRFAEALKIFRSMMNDGIRPNRFTLSTVLNACAGDSSLVMGIQVHGVMSKLGIPADVVTETALVDMYGKCGDMDSASKVFESMPDRNLASWNSMIGGYARNGSTHIAFQVFDEMSKSGTSPDEVTFINVLSACVHGGTVKQGEELFDSMKSKYGIRPEIEHFSCMVDLYGRAGELEKAEELVRNLPFEPDVVVWGALFFGACGLHSHPDSVRTAADGLSKRE
ncbi:hypothetical protein M569_09880, partial [Genlisea aurea]